MNRPDNKQPPSLHPQLHPETPTVREIARTFARLVADRVGVHTWKIDVRNFRGSDSNCRSFGFCDANVFMRDAILAVTGRDVSTELPEVSTLTQALWDYAWDYTQRIGFRRLSAVRGVPDAPPEDMTVVTTPSGRSMEVALPTLPPLEEGGYALEIELDYRGRNPHLQVLCRNHDSGEPVVCVRYDQNGKVVEVVIADPNVLVTGDFDRAIVQVHRGKGDTPWEVERDANPTCIEGDKLRMPSGLTADVIRLRDRYDSDIESFRAYDETYGILERLDGYPGDAKRNQVYGSIEQAWEVNPLTAATVEPTDFSFVPELQTTAQNDEGA